MKKLIVLALLFLAFPVVKARGEGELAGKVKMTAEVLSVGDRIHVNVIESKYTFGEHIVITGENTKYFDVCGEKIHREDIKVGDRVEIFYNGQVMMSYPPQIVARKIIRI